LGAELEISERRVLTTGSVTKASGAEAGGIGANRRSF
jgi:hypothetical protein